jgi:hypothetical protein
MKTSTAYLVALLAAIAIPETALAYVGPGAGLVLLGALLGVLAAIVLAIIGVLMWPIRAMLAWWRQAKKETPRATQS